MAAEGNPQRPRGGERALRFMFPTKVDSSH